MATSIELENAGRERYMVKDVKAKIQVDRISKELKALEVDDKDFVNRNVESKIIKDDESKEDKIDQLATSIELENVGRERYMVKDDKAKIQVDRISKELKALEVDDKEDLEAGAEAGKQRVREVFHTDVAELIIERDAWIDIVCYLTKNKL